MNVNPLVTIEKTTYRGWPDCYRLTNGDVELVITTNVGPRIIRCGFVDGQNFFKEFTSQLGKSGEAEWQPRGGHRLWTAPESVPGSYALDNGPVEARVKPNGIHLIQPVEPETGFQKEISVTLASSGSRVEVVHQLRNTNSSVRTVAPWALTMMAQGGTAVAAFPPRGTHPEVLAPTNPLVMWAFTNFADPRWKITERHLILRQDPHATTPVKAGLWNRKTWQGYLLGSEMFLKSVDVSEGPERYTDMGCSLETFTNADFLEMETLGPLESVAPQGVIGHTETWALHRNVVVPEWSDEEIERVVVPLVPR